MSAARGKPNGLILGVPSNWFFDMCDSPVREATMRALSILESAGVKLQEVSLPHAPLMEAIGRTIIDSEVASAHFQENTGDYSPDLRRLVVEGASVLAVEYIHALRARNLLQEDFRQVFESVDAIVVPSVGCVAPRGSDMAVEINGETHRWNAVAARTTRIFNIVGIPAISVPIGFHGDLPLGMQVAARPFDEGTCFRVTGAYQALTDYHRRLPFNLAEVDASHIAYGPT
jgi:Asp-tRNA(Asn)/Glu-tRNA(Gln) amidotransferase A subunit family amidase